MDFRVLVPLKITFTLAWQKILLNSALRPGILGTKIKMFFFFNFQTSFWDYNGIGGCFTGSLMIQSG